MPNFWALMQDIAGAPCEQDPERYERLSMCNYIGEQNPPTFFIEAELEHLFPWTDTLEICKKHRDMGIVSHWKVYTRMEHGFFYELKRNGQKETFEDICLFLEGKLESL